MTETTAWLLLLVALILIAGLAGYAYSLWREVGRRKRFREEEVQRANRNCLESLDGLARAMLAEQVDLTEGSLRCKVLLEIIDPRLIERNAFQVFAEVHRRTSHLHTHSARAALTPRERLGEDRERLAVEADLRQEVLAAAQAVLDFKQRWPASLH